MVSEARKQLIERLRTEPQAFTFRELRKICEEAFGAPRNRGGSHLIFKTGLRSPALVNIQPRGKMAKPYQCRQVADAIEAKERDKEKDKKSEKT